MRKNLQICLDGANRNEAELTVTAVVVQFYKEAQVMEQNRADTSSLILLLNKD